MESHAKLLGHPIHPMLVVFPLGLLSFGVLFDAAYLLSGDEQFATVAFWAITGGIIGGLVAAPFGLVDWFALPGGTRAKQIGLYHGVGNVAIVVLFIVSWLLRMPDPAYAPDILPFVLGVIGIAAAVVTGWLGGELVYRLRVGVDRGAHLDAPSSIGGEEDARAETR